MPRLARRRLPATFFVSTGSLHSGKHWHQRAVGVIREMRDHSHMPVGLPDGFPILELTSPKSRQRTLDSLETWLKQMPPSLRDETLTRLEQAQPVEPGGNQALDWNGLQSLASAGFAIGAHSCRHPILSRISLEESRREIIECREELQQNLRIPIAGFAYPNGRPGIDFDSRHVDIVRQAGYSFAVTTSRGSVNAQDDRFMLRRFTPWGLTAAACSRQTLASLFYAR
jgi:peptidoglycan/xylan/chitin deacetylase (PgdA/CDA1 family)